MNQEKRKWNSSLPNLASLRKEAEACGLDHSPYGRSKRKLLAAIEAQKDRPPWVKTAPSVLPPVILNPPFDT
jgi:hypothetical protein